MDINQTKTNRIFKKQLRLCGKRPWSQEKNVETLKGSTSLQSSGVGRRKSHLQPLIILFFLRVSLWCSFCHVLPDMGPPTLLDFLEYGFNMF